MMDTRGVPLETIVQEFEKNNCLVDWIDFYENSIQSGWNPQTTLDRIEYTLIDVKGKEYSNDVLLRLKIYIGGSLW